MLGQFLRLGMLLFVGLATFSVWAEGNCPPGYYPIGGQGVQGCAPVPGSQGSGREVLPPPSPSGRWHSRWGAFAQSPTTGFAGASTGMAGEAEAEAEAIRRCAASGARDCEAVLTYANQCAVWLVPVSDKPGSKVGVASGRTLAIAKENAARSCRDVAGGECEIFYQDCANPEFERF